MALTVRPADLMNERDQLVHFLQGSLTQLDHNRRFDWLYIQNPAGEGMAWFACEENSDRIVGAASVFPRKLWVGKELQTCGQVGDFGVDPTHRSLGPAIMLQRATLEPVNRGRLSFCYDCPPHERGMAPFRRMGVAPASRIHRYARLLRSGPWLARRLGLSESTLLPLAALTDAVLFRATKPPTLRGVEVEPLTGPFDEEFSQLDTRVGASENVIRSQRSSEDLNWRYRRDPLRAFRVLTARRNGELMGFLVYSTPAAAGEIVDWLCIDPEITRALMDVALSQLKEEKLDRVQSFVTDVGHEGRCLTRSAFVARESAGYLVPYASPGGSTDRSLRKTWRWAFTFADLMS